MNNTDTIDLCAYSLLKWTLFRDCISRDLLLMKRNSVLNVHKAIQVSMRSIGTSVLLAIVLVSSILKLI